MGGSAKVRTLKGRGVFAFLLTLALSVPLVPAVLPATSGVEPVAIRALSDPAPAILLNAGTQRVEQAKQRTTSLASLPPVHPVAGAVERRRRLGPARDARPWQAPSLRADRGRSPPAIS